MEDPSSLFSRRNFLGMITAGGIVANAAEDASAAITMDTVITNPEPSATVASPLTITGTATAPDGVDSVMVSIFDRVNLKWWNNGSWGSWMHSPATITLNADGTSASWTSVFDPAGTDGSGKYRVFARVRDNNGTLDTPKKTNFAISLDSAVTLETFITSPLPDAEVTGPVTISGTGTAPGGVDTVLISIFDSLNLKWWNNGNWGDWIHYPATVTLDGNGTSASWTTSFDPAGSGGSGQYRVFARVRDNNGTKDTTEKVNFTVTSVPVISVSPEIHLLNRITYGPIPQSIQQIEQLGIESYLDQQLDYLSIDDNGLEDHIRLRFPVIYYDGTQFVTNTDKNQAKNQLIHATLLRRAVSKRQLYERMVEFWSDHFHTSINTGAVKYLKSIEDRESIRPHAMGTFREILGASAKSLAMLYYLDNRKNYAAGPNENYSRELLELHTLGIDGGYTEEDIKEVARCFTGWSYRTATKEFKFKAAKHDTGTKQVLGHTIPSGGIAEGEQVLDILAAHPSTARFIANKLIRFFVQDPPDAILSDALSNAYLASGGDIKTVLRTLFLHDRFYLSTGKKLKRPDEFLLSAMRKTGLDSTIALNDRKLKATRKQLISAGHMPFGWPAPNGAPMTAPYWLNTGAMLKRWNMMHWVIDTARTAKIKGLSSQAANPRTLISNMADAILNRPLADNERSRIISLVFDGLAEDAILSNSDRTRYSYLVGQVLLGLKYFQYK